MFIRRTGLIAGLAILILAVIAVAPAAAYTIDGHTFAHGLEHTENGVAGTTLTYYPVSFTLSNATGVSTGDTIYTNGTTAADWRDVRFTTGADAVLPHWIETTTATTAFVWVNVTSIPETGTTIRFYYDSDTATQASSGTSTFPFYDDFSTGLDTTTRWSTYGSPSVSNGIASCANAQIYTKTTWGAGYAAHARTASANYANMVIWRPGGTTDYPQHSIDKTVLANYNARDTNATNQAMADMDLGVAANTNYHHFAIARISSSLIRRSIDNAIVHNQTSSTYITTGALPAMVRTWAAGNTVTVDWAFVCKAVATEPSHGSYTVMAPPVADFSADPTSGGHPLTVQFTDASTGSPSAWAWDFDNDGDTDSTDQNPTYEYASEGTYSVNLTVTNAYESDSETKTDYITVNPYVVPVAAFSANVTSGYTPLAVAFTDSSTGPPTEWAWTFTGPNEFYDLDLNQNPVLTFTDPGTYSVSLRASNPAGNDYENKTAYITVLEIPAGPVASFTASTVSGHAPLVVQFTDTSTGSPTAWAWDFDGDAVADSTEQNPTYEYAANGTYTVTLQVSNAGGTDLETKTGYVYVGELTARLLRASFSYSTPIGTAPFSVSFADTSASNGTYARVWDFGDGATSTEPAPVHEYATAGKYDVELVITSDYTQDTSAARKAVMAYPAAAVSPLPTTTFGAHMTEIMESEWNVSVIGPIIPRAYTDALTPLAGDTGVGNMIFWGIIWVGVFMILFLRQGTPWLAALVGLVAGPGILTFLPPDWAHVGYICLAVTIGCSFFVIALGRFRST